MLYCLVGIRPRRLRYPTDDPLPFLQFSLTMASTSPDDPIDPDPPDNMDTNHTSTDNPASSYEKGPPSNNTFAVKFEFHVKNNQFAAPSIHKSILDALHEVLPCTRITTNRNASTFIDPTTLSEEEFMASFDYKSFPRSTHRRVCFAHNIITRASFNDIRESIKYILRQHNGFIRINPWNEDDLDIVNVGWIYQAHPKLHNRDLICHLINQYCLDNSISTVPLEIFPKTIVAYDPNDNNKRITTNAIHFACKNSDSRDAKNMLKTCFTSSESLLPGIYIPNDLSNKEGMHVLSKYVKHQNLYLHNHRAITVMGIHPDDLFTTYTDSSNKTSSIFEKCLQAPTVTWLTTTKFSTKSGKVIISTTKEKYTLATEWIDTHLLPSHRFITDPQPLITFKSTSPYRIKPKQYNNDQYTKSLASNISDITDDTASYPVSNAWSKPLQIITKPSKEQNNQSQTTLSNQSSLATLQTAIETLTQNVHNLKNELNTIKQTIASNNSPHIESQVKSYVDDTLKSNLTSFDNKYQQLFDDMQTHLADLINTINPIIKNLKDNTISSQDHSKSSVSIASGNKLTRSNSCGSSRMKKIPRKAPPDDNPPVQSKINSFLTQTDSTPSTDDMTDD